MRMHSETHIRRSLTQSGKVSPALKASVTSSNTICPLRAYCVRVPLGYAKSTPPPVKSTPLIFFKDARNSSSDT